MCTFRGFVRNNIEENKREEISVLIIGDLEGE